MAKPKNKSQKKVSAEQDASSDDSERTLSDDRSDAAVQSENSEQRGDSSKPSEAAPGVAEANVQPASPNTDPLVQEEDSESNHSDFIEHFEHDKKAVPSQLKDPHLSKETGDANFRLLDERIRSEASIRNVELEKLQSLLISNDHKHKDKIDVLARDISRLDEALKHEWKYPKIVTWLILFVSGLVFAANFRNQHHVTQELKDQGDRLLAKIDKRQEDMSTLDDRIDKKIDKKVEPIDDRLESIGKALKASKAAVSDHGVSLGVASGVYDAIGLLNLGQRHLAEQNPEKANYYANKALAVVDRQRDRIDSHVSSGLKELKDALIRLRKPVLILKAESLVQLDQPQSAMETAMLLHEDECDCPEAFHYEAMGHLDAAATHTNDEKRAIARRQAIVALEKSMKKQEESEMEDVPSFDTVLLAAAHFDDANYHRAAKTARNFEKPFESVLKSKLSNRVSAHLIVADWLIRLCDGILDHRSEEIEARSNRESCDPIPGSLGIVEGRVMEQLFSAAPRRVPQGVPMSDVKRKRYEEACLIASEQAILLATPLCEFPMPIAAEGRRPIRDVPPPPSVAPVEER